MEKLRLLHSLSKSVPLTYSVQGSVLGMGELDKKVSATCLLRALRKLQVDAD